MEFHELPTTRKGTAGERLAIAYLNEIGVETFDPTASGPHSVDLFAICSNGRPLFIDVKTYPRRYRDESTGIDAADLHKYQRLEAETGIPVYLLFVDVFERAMYGALISDLDGNRKVERTKVYFPLSAFRVLKQLSAADLLKLAPIKEPERYRNVAPYFGKR